MRLPIILATLLALAACSPPKEPPQECRDKRTGWTGHSFAYNAFRVELRDKDGWERDYRWEDVECRDLPHQ